MDRFKNKSQVLAYITKRFKPGSRLVLLRGSMSSRPVKNFSDFDVEVYGKRAKKPHYEIVFVKNKIVLVTAYFYRFQKGKIAGPPKGVRALYGRYNDRVKPDFSRDTYTHGEKIQRECQLVMDFFFKYLRTKNAKHLESVQKRL